MDRQAELERKRQKLAELRKAREERKVQISQSPAKQQQQNVDQLVASLVGPAVDQKKDQELQLQKIVKLTRHSIVVVDQKPSLPVHTYDKQTQTNEYEVPQVDEESVRRNIIDNEVPRLIQDALAKVQKPVVDVKPKAQKKINVEQVLQSQKFQDFMEQSTKVMERSLTEKHYDIFFDYTSSKANYETSKTLTQVKSYSADVPITDLSWSQFFPELTLSALASADGTVAIWNLHSDQREFTLKSSSPVSCAQFSTFHPNLVVGGINAGKVVIWDFRVRSPYPVLSSSHSGHMQRIQGLQFVGSSKAHNLTSISEDGVYCSWQMDMLAKPLETVSVFNSMMLDCTVNSYGFPSVADTSTFYVGLEDGRVRAVNIHDQVGMKSGLVESKAYAGHLSSVSSLQFHPSKGGELSDLFLTSSFDWSVKLWKKDQLEPIYTLDQFEDYVYDVKWSPTHPAVFACVDGTGQLSVWNINHSSEEPLYTVQVSDQAINKVSWNKFGNKLSCAGRDGKVVVFDVAIESTTKDTASLLRTLF